MFFEDACQRLSYSFDVRERSERLASVIDKGTFRTRKTLEAWHTTVTGHLTQITIRALYLDNTTFFLTNIHNFLHSHHFAMYVFT